VKTNEALHNVAVFTVKLFPRHSPQQPVLKYTQSIFFFLKQETKFHTYAKQEAKITQLNSVISFHYHQANTRASDASLVSTATLIPPIRQTRKARVSQTSARGMWRSLLHRRLVTILAVSAFLFYAVQGSFQYLR
jgi:hypothetical protein